MARLNGWQRIGVLLSIIWFIGFAAYVWYGDRKHKSDFYLSSLGFCSRLWDGAAERSMNIQDTQEREKKRGS
jgi:hypothetical protein